jgi:hypothetical protein
VAENTGASNELDALPQLRATHAQLDQVGTVHQGAGRQRSLASRGNSRRGSRGTGSKRDWGTTVTAAGLRRADDGTVARADCGPADTVQRRPLCCPSPLQASTCSRSFRSPSGTGRQKRNVRCTADPIAIGILPTSTAVVCRPTCIDFRAPRFFPNPWQPSALRSP